MKRYIALTALPLLVSGLIHAHTLADSVGIEQKDGKRFILHRVDEGQTLFAIARRYGRSVAAIKAANPDIKDAVRYDQLVRIPVPNVAKPIDKPIREEEKFKKREAKTTTPDASTTTTAKRPAKEIHRSNDPAKAGIHVVEPKQTLYSLAVRYGVAQSDLRKWNNLPNNNVLIGQALIVSEKAYVARIPSTPVASVPVKTPVPSHTDTPTRTTPKPEHTAPRHPTDEPATNSAKTDNQPTATNPKTEDVVLETPRPGNDAPMPTRGRRVATSGVAEMIEGDGSGKYLALHRTAPIGTLVQVRNAFNNQSLWVKVIGRLPDTGVNDKILIKLSTQAFAKLSPQDRRFRAEVSYIAP